MPAAIPPPSPTSMVAFFAVDSVVAGFAEFSLSAYGLNSRESSYDRKALLQPPFPIGRLVGPVPCFPLETKSGVAVEGDKRRSTYLSGQSHATVEVSNMKAVAFLLMTLVSAAASAQQKPTTGYAPVNGVKMYYEVHGSGEPVVLLHGAFMTITNNWTGWIGELSKTRKVIAVEMQGHGRTADTQRDITYENLADDVAALLEQLKIPRADLIGYSMGGAVAMQCAIRHPDKVRKVVVISSMFRRDGMVKEALDALPKLTADDFKGSPIEAEYKKLSPTPDDFPNFVKRIVATASKGDDFGADKLKATTAPMFFIHGDADGVRLEHVAEMFRLKGGEIHGDMKPRSASRLAILPNTTHVTLMQRMAVIVAMVNDFLDAKP